MLDELAALIVSMWSARDGGVDEWIEDMEISLEGEEPIARLKHLEKNFNPYRLLDIKPFMVNLGSYLSELINTFSLNMGEYAILHEFLTDNVDDISYVGTIINRIEMDKQSRKDKYNDFS